MIEVGVFDKPLHFVLSFLLALIHPVVAAVAGVGKEVFDALTGGFVDGWDLLADALGIVAGVLVSL